MIKILIIGKSGRLDCIEEAVFSSSRDKLIYTIAPVKTPGILEKTTAFKKGSTEDLNLIITYAKYCKPDFAIIGPEDPLSIGVVDALNNIGISCIGPTKLLAKIECSKLFTRELLTKYNIDGNPEYRAFDSMIGLEDYLISLGTFVVKPDGLTAGKGVKVYGEHLTSIEETIDYCESILAEHTSFLIEERLDGEEFSLQAFCDGDHVINTIAVQDHKRAFNGDKGPNTGGMGSYSDGVCLPFLSTEHMKQAGNINVEVANALKNEMGEGFKGILYGGFILTKNGLKLLEYNARFGDPEVMNVLPLLQTDFIDICEAIINGTLNKLSIVFKKKATVCKYLVPSGYPTNPAKLSVINYNHMPMPHENLKIYYGAVDETVNKDVYFLTGSRAIAFVGIGDTLEEAEKIAEEAICKVKGPFHHRSDIGTMEVIQKRIEHMEKLNGKI